MPDGLIKQDNHSTFVIRQIICLLNLTSLTGLCFFLQYSMLRQLLTALCCFLHASMLCQSKDTSHSAARQECMSSGEIDDSTGGGSLKECQEKEGPKSKFER